MRYYLRVRGSYKWHDITKYVQDPTILNITVDGSYMQLDMVARFPTSVDFFDVKKPIPPKWEIRVRDESELEEELVNTYYFITDNQSSLNKRKEVKENNNVIIDGLYEHKITGNNRLYLLEGKYAPNYTVTQPKTKYFDVYRKSGGGRFVINQKLQEDGEVKVLAEGNKVLLPDRNNDDNTITIGYDSEEQKHYIEVKDIDKRTFSINFEIALQKTANGKISFRNFIIPRTTPVTTLGDFAKLKFQKYYYRDEVRTSREPEELELSYDGGFVDYESSWGNYFITSFGQQKVVSASTTIQRHTHSNKARLYFSYISNESYNRIDSYQLGIHGNTDTNIAGTDINAFVKTNILSLQVTATSSAYESALENEKYTTLYELLEKAVFDYNLNSRDKLYLNDNDLEVKLAVPVKESEWGDYNYKELIERIFKYVGLSPYLTKDNLITYIRQNKSGVSIDVEQEGLNQKEHKGEFFYDRAISNSKNLVSEQDFITEVLPITSIDEEFSQLTSDTVGFLASNDIYFLSNAILYAPNLVIDFGNVEVKSNTNKDFYWDITSRLFESDIYNSFPDVRYDVKGEKINGNYIDLRSMPDKYSKSNVISYKSGSNVISNLGHLAPRIPTFTGLEILTGTPEYLDPQYSVIEMLIVLAYSQLTAEQIEEVIDPKPIDSNLSGDIKMSIISDFELEITYAPIYKELTTKHSSNMKDRRGLNFEKKFNMTNKTISYDESSKVLRNEMESKGNVKILHSNTVKKLSDTLPINSIINDNLYLVTKTMSLHKNKIDVDYILQENFLLQNEDISLPVAFDRFEVPYEYVNREVMLDNHLIFDTNVMLGLIDKRAVNKAFLQKVFLDNDFEGTIYGKAELDRSDESNLSVLLRMGVIKTDFSMIMSGRFLDNYSAGVQRYAYNEGDYNLLYSQPYRYTNAKGKLYAVNSFSVGWDNSGNSLRLNDYDVRTFPEGKNVNNFQTELFNFEERLLLYKDAREALSFVHTSYLESNNEDIKFYSFNKINGIGILVNDIVFRDDLTLEEIDYTEVENGIDEITFEELGTNHFQVRLRLSSPNIYNFPNGLILFNKDETEYSLVGLIKNFDYEDTKTIIFYITSSRYGVMPTELLGDTVLSELVELYSDSEVSYVSGTTIDLESNFTTLALLNMGETHTVVYGETFYVEANLEYINGDVISLNNQSFISTQFAKGLSYAKQLDNKIELETNILILNGTIIDLNSNIYGNIDINKGSSQTKSYILKHYFDKELDYVSGEVIDLVNNLYGNVEIGEGYTYKGNYILKYSVDNELDYISGEVIELENNLYGNIDINKGSSHTKSYVFKPKIDNDIDYVSGVVIELESNFYGNVEIGEGYSYKGNYNLDFDTNSDIMYIQGDIINLDNMMFNSLSFDKRYDMHKTFDLKPKIDNELGYVSGEVIELESVVVTSFSTITYSPVPPSTTASSGNYGQVLTGADGYSQWECMRTSENIMNWVENGTTDDVNVPIVNEGGSCYTWLDSGRGRFFVDLEARVYVRYLCEVTSVVHTYYWELVS